MDKNKSQHYNFTHEALPMVFHGNAEHFFEYLDRDGDKFLRFYWNHLTKNLGVLIESSYEGINFQIRELNPKTKAAFIHLSTPATVGEVYCMLLVKLPEKFQIFRVGFTRVFALQLEGIDIDQKPLTGVYEITPRGRNVRILDGISTDQEEFIRMVKHYLKV